MISFHSKVCNVALKNCVKNSKCGFKTKSDSLKLPNNNFTEQNFSAEFSSNSSSSHFFHQFSFGPFVSPYLVDGRRRLLFRDKYTVTPIFVRYFASNEKSSKEKGETKSSAEKPKPKTQLKKIGDDESVINQILLDKYRVPEPQTTAEKVKFKEGVKDVYYFSAFAVAVIVTCSLLYYVFREMLSSKSPSGVYSRALKIVQADSKVEDALGHPLKGYGEETRRGRRRDVSHIEYIKDGINYMRVKFYVQGPQGKGTVRLEVKEDEFGKYEFRYLLVETDTMPMKSIVIIDDR